MSIARNIHYSWPVGIDEGASTTLMTRGSWLRHIAPCCVVGHHALRSRPGFDYILALGRRVARPIRRAVLSRFMLPRNRHVACYSLLSAPAYRARMPAKIGISTSSQNILRRPTAEKIARALIIGVSCNGMPSWACMCAASKHLLMTS